MKMSQHQEIAHDRVNFFFYFCFLEIGWPYVQIRLGLGLLGID